MAIVYVDSVAGSATAPYDTWAKAATSIATVLPGAAGDEIRVSSAHVENHTATSLTLTSNGTITQPIIIVSTNKADDTYLRGATIDVAGGTLDLILGAGYTRWYGCDLKATDDITLTAADGSRWFEDCHLYLTGTGSDNLNCGGDDNIHYFRNCKFSFGHSSQSFYMGGNGSLIMDGCSHVAGTTSIADLMTVFNSRPKNVTLRNCDFSSLLTAAGKIIGDLPVAPNDGHGHQFELSNIKLGSSQVITSASFADEWSEIRAYNVETGTGNNEFMVQNYRGKATQEETIVRNATHDGTNKYSVKMVANTNSIEFIAPFKMEVIGPFFAAANSTIRVDFVHDSQGDGTSSQMQNDEFWLELAHPTLNSAQHTVLTKRKADYHAANADVQSGAGSGWTTTGLTTPVSEQCTFTVTGGAAGMHYITAYLANAATETTVYVDPEPTVT